MNDLGEYQKQARFLIVDDEWPNVRLLENLLEDEGQLNFLSTTDSRRAVALYQEFQPDVLLLDLMMPHIDGFAIIQQLRSTIPANDYLPVIVLTADISPETRQRALAAGARDFLTKPFDAAELQLRVRNLLELRFLHRGLQEQNRELDARVKARTMDLEAAVAELKAAQSQVIEQERLRAFSEMAGGVVHDFNNSLGIVLGYSEFLLSPDTLDDRARSIECVKAINTAARDAAHVVGRLRDFYRPREATDLTEGGNLKKLLEEASKLTRPRWKDQALAEGRQFEVLYELEEVAPIACNPSEIREMLVNLIFNAVDAMPNGGRLTLRTYQQEGRIAFDIGDSGTGMTEEVRRRCMEPFFSTKGDKGTGLGLAMVFGIIQRHDGKLDIESQLGVGTTFRISFPPKAAATEAAPQKLDSKANRPLHILFAEDDPELRTIIPYTLEAQGHFVTIASDGSEALLRLADMNFDLLMTDFSMPVVNGEQLAAAAKKIAKDMPVILLTGFGNMNRADGALPHGVDLIVEKPFTSNDLETAIGWVLTH